jgi:GAF domain-containing protein
MDLRRSAVREARKRINGVPDPELTGVAARLKVETGSESAWISFVTQRRAYVVGSAGMPEALLGSGSRGVPVRESFCAHLVSSGEGEGEGLIVNDTRRFPLLKDCPTIGTLGSWVGAPIRFRKQVIGAVGVGGPGQRNWPQGTLDDVREAAEAVERQLTEVELGQ